MPAAPVSSSSFAERARNSRRLGPLVFAHLPPPCRGAGGRRAAAASTARLLQPRVVRLVAARAGLAPGVVRRPRPAGSAPGGRRWPGGSGRTARGCRAAAPSARRIGRVTRQRAVAGLAADVLVRAAPGRVRGVGVTVQAGGATRVRQRRGCGCLRARRRGSGRSGRTLPGRAAPGAPANASTPARKSAPTRTRCPLCPRRPLIGSRPPHRSSGPFRYPSSTKGPDAPNGTNSLHYPESSTRRAKSQMVHSGESKCSRRLESGELHRTRWHATRPRIIGGLRRCVGDC